MIVSKHELKQRIDYRVELMDTAEGKGFNLKAGMVLDVLSDGKDFVAIPPADDYNRGRYLNMENVQIVGRGVLVEKIGTEWFVAWRPFVPKPEIDYTGWER